MKKIVLLLLLLVFLAPGLALAELGVGIGSGKIEVREDLKPGMIYQLPGLSVFNTGDEEANYQMRVSYHNK